MSNRRSPVSPVLTAGETAAAAVLAGVFLAAGAFLAGAHLAARLAGGRQFDAGLT